MFKVCSVESVESVVQKVFVRGDVASPGGRHFSSETGVEWGVSGDAHTVKLDQLSPPQLEAGKMTSVLETADLINRIGSGGSTADTVLAALHAKFIDRFQLTMLDVWDNSFYTIPAMKVLNCLVLIGVGTSNCRNLGGVDPDKMALITKAAKKNLASLLAKGGLKLALQGPDPVFFNEFLGLEGVTYVAASEAKYVVESAVNCTYKERGKDMKADDSVFRRPCGHFESDGDSAVRLFTLYTQVAHLPDQQLLKVPGQKAGQLLYVLRSSNLTDPEAPREVSGYLTEQMAQLRELVRLDHKRAVSWDADAKPVPLPNLESTVKRDFTTELLHMAGFETEDQFLLGAFAPNLLVSCESRLLMNKSGCGMEDKFRVIPSRGKPELSIFLPYVVCVVEDGQIVGEVHVGSSRLLKTDMGKRGAAPHSSTDLDRELANSEHRSRRRGRRATVSQK